MIDLTKWHNWLAIAGVALVVFYVLKMVPVAAVQNARHAALS